MNPDGMTPEQMGMKKKDAPEFDLESIALSPEMEQTLKRVGANYPTMAAEALIAQRDIRAGESFKQGIPESDTEAHKVWDGLNSFLQENVVAVETWLGERVKLAELWEVDQEADGVADSLVNEEAPYIRAAFRNQPITLSELLREIKAASIEVEAVAPTLTPEGEEAGIALLHARIQSEADAERQADEVLKRIQGGK